MPFNTSPKQRAFSMKSVFISLASFALLIYTVRTSGLQWSHLLLSGEQWFYFFSAMLVLLLTIWTHSFRAKIPWEAWRATTSLDTFNGLFLGNFYNCVLPGNLGEGVRAWHFSRKNNIAFIRSLASIAVEKYLDGLNYMLFTLLLLLLFPEVEARFHLMIAVCAVVSIIFFGYLLIITQRNVERFIAGILLCAKPGRWLYKLHFHIKSLLKGFNKARIMRYLLIGYFMFLLNTVQYYLAMKAAHVPEPLADMRVAFLVAVAMVLVSITPSAPGNTGVIHFGIYTLLLSFATTYSIPVTDELKQTLALYTIYLHLSYFLPEVIAGGIVLVKERHWLV